MIFKNAFKLTYVFTALLILSACGVLDQSMAVSDRQAISRQTSIQQIALLQAKYLQYYDQIEGRHKDRPAAESVVDELFTENGEWLVEYEGKASGYRGKAELITMFNEVEIRHINKKSHFVKHFSMNPQTNIKGDQATQLEQFMVLHSDEGDQEAYWIVGHYIDKLKKNADGQWRFVSKTAVIEDVSHWSLTEK